MTTAVLVLGGGLMVARGAYMLYVIWCQGLSLHGWVDRILFAFIALVSLVTVGIGAFAILSGVTA